MSKVRESLLVAFSAANAITVIEFGATLVLARLLTPAEIGVYAVAAVLVSIAHVLRNFGTGTYIVQERELTPARLRSAFGAMLLVSWALGIVLLLSSAPVARFYGEPGVRQVLLLLTVNMLLVPFGAVTMACLQREMRFVVVSGINVAAALVSAGVSIALAFAGFGYMSLAWGSLAGLVVTVACVSCFRPGYMPWRPGFTDLRRVMAFGAYTTGAEVAGTVGRGAPDIILGKMLGMEAVGLFGRALGVVRIFGRLTLRAVTGVALPYFSQQQRAGGDLKRSFLLSAAHFTGVAFSFYAVLAILAFPIVRLLYGPQWDASIPLVRILCIAFALGAPFGLTDSVLLAAGRPKYQLLLVMASLPVRIALIILAAPWGMTAVAVTFILNSGVSFAVHLAVLRRVIGLGPGELLGAIWRSAGVALLAVAGPALVWLLVPAGGAGHWILLVAGGLTGAAGWCLGLCAFRHPLRDEVMAVARTFR